MRSERDDLLLDVLLQLGGKKNKRDDWITLSGKVRTLVGQYASLEEVAAKLQVSSQVVRSISSLMDLPPEVKRLVRKRLILYDAAYRLHTLQPAAKQVEVAQAIQGLPSHTQRAAIQYAQAHSLADLSDFLERLKSPRVIAKKTHLIVVPVPDDEMALLKKYCKAHDISINVAVGRAIRSLASLGKGP